MSCYETYKHSGIEWIGEVPKHWKVVSLKNVLLSMTNGTTITQDPFEEGIPVTRIETISDGTINLENTGIIPSDVGIENYYLSKGDILFSHINSFEYVANSAIFDLDVRLLHGMNLLRFIPNKTRIEPYFLIYLLKSDYFKKLTQSVCNRAINQVSISNSKLKNFKIVIPEDKSEQLTIANYLDDQTQKIDRLIANKKAQAEKLKELRKIEINNAVTKGLNPNAEMKDSGIEWLGKIPKHWEVKRLKDITSMQSGESITSKDFIDDGEYPVYGGNGLRGYFCSYTHDGDYVLIGRQGALCGNVNYASGKFWASEHAVIVTPKKKLDTFWLGELLRTMNLNQYSVASAQPGLSVEKILFHKVPFPPIEEQIEIANYLQQCTTAIDQLIKNIEAQIEKLQELRKIIIYEAVTGKIKVNGYEKGN